MTITDQYQQLRDTVSFIDKQTSNSLIPDDERSRLAVGCFDMAIEHQAAILILIGASLHGSAFSLLRVLFESLVRGLWIIHCANDQGIADFKSGKIGKTNIANLIKEIEENNALSKHTLSKFKSNSWEALNDFTHTGPHQLSYRRSSERIENNYPPTETSKLINSTKILGLLLTRQ
jgi:hypothetical protein